MTTFLQGETIPSKVTILDKDGALVNPTTVTITIKNPSGTSVVDAVAMTNKSTGVYYHDYTTAADAPAGAWERQVIASSGNPVIDRDSFWVAEL